MRSRTVRSLIIVGLSVCLVSAAFAAEGWRIAFGGGRITGIVGTLAKYGLPRTYLTDEELADPEVLADFQVVIVTAPVGNAGAVSRAVADFVADGGYAITESHAIPPESVIAGERLGPKRSPNMIFRDVDHPISRAMQGTGAINTRGYQAMAITPADADAATVLAHFTDDGVPDKYRGELTGGRADLPAMMLIKHGAGQWLYSGAPIGVSLALQGPQLQPAVLAALEHFSHGDLAPRFVTLRESFSFELPSSHKGERLLPQTQWSPRVEEQAERPAPREEAAEELPEGFEALDLPEDAPEDLVLTGTLVAGGSAKIMLPWLNGRWYRIVRIAEGRVELVAVDNGHERRLSDAPMPTGNGPMQVVIRRRPHSVTVFAGSSALLMAPLEPMAGTFASNGLQEAFVQPCAPVVFEDDFMRAEGTGNPWETPSGTWKLFQVEGEPEHGANPFAFRAQSDAIATALAGYWFWDDYDYSVAVRPQAESVSLLAHWQDQKDYLELRLRLPEGGEASLELIRMQPGGERVLSSSPVEAARDRWHQLRLRVSRGRALCDLNGREVLRVANEALRGRGMVGLRLRGGSGFFDDARVGPWEALPLPLDGQGAWRVERGRLKALRAGIALEPTGSATAVAPMGPLTNVHASAALRLGQARQAGLLLRYRSPRDHFEVGLSRRDGLRLVLARMADGQRTVLAERALGGAPGDWHELSATMDGGHVRVRVDGQQALSAADGTMAPGRVALACEGGEAAFRDVAAWRADHERFRADPPTLPYVGIIDAHTWAGAGSGWQPRPEDLDLFWHRGLYVDDVEVRLGVHRTDHGAATASLVIGDGTGLHSGYAVRAEQPSTTEPVTVKLMRAGEWISTREAEAWSEEGYVLSLRRVGNVIVAAVDGQTICQLRDPEPLEGLDRVGFRRDDAIIDPGDVAVLSSAVRTYTFEEAPVDWQAESGTWEVSTRWSCQPEWTWLAGWNQTGQALTHTRWRAAGRQMIDVYVGAKMMPKPDGKGHYEELRDLHFGLCGDGEGGGYHIVLGGQNNTVSSIRRNGILVAQSTARSIPQSERHNNWLLVTILRDGPTISARIWDREVLSFTDNRPLEGGVVSVGTENNGIIVPRVTIYGSPAR